MLVALKVCNYALIEDLNLDFTTGLNVLSGETGAGKSIVIGALNLLLGERAAVEQIRQGEDAAYVEGIIKTGSLLRDSIDHLFEEAGIEMDDELILAREIFRSGRSVARVNGRAVPLSFLKEMGQMLVDLHGQHQHQSLLRPEKHLDLLDSFGGEDIQRSRSRVAALYKKRQHLGKELAALGSSGAERERSLDVNAFQLKEIRSAELSPAEDEELFRRERILANAEKLWALVSQAYGDIYAGEENGATAALIDRLNRSQALLSEAAAFDPDLKPLCELLQGASAQVEEVSLELRDYRSKLEFDPSELALIQERLNLINGLKKKYGPTVGDVLDFAEKLERDMERLQNSEALAAKLEAQIAELDQELALEGEKLRSLRLETAKRLQDYLRESLTELALANAGFEVKFVEKEEMSFKGMDQVEFLFSANRGEVLKPLAKIISGGEVSRVMLALKTILARQDLVPTLVFDEVDSGIGGTTIQAVAEKLTHLARHHQVLCVTHSPQIAAMADCHFQLFKETVSGRTLTRAVRLYADQRREELARMLDGASIDHVSLRHVDSLLDRAKQFKEGLLKSP